MEVVVVAAAATTTTTTTNATTMTTIVCFLVLAFGSHLNDFNPCTVGQSLSSLQFMCFPSPTGRNLVNNFATVVNIIPRTRIPELVSPNDCTRGEGER